MRMGTPGTGPHSHGENGDLVGKMRTPSILLCSTTAYSYKRHASACIKGGLSRYSGGVSRATYRLEFDSD